MVDYESKTERLKAMAIRPGRVYPAGRSRESGKELRVENGNRPAGCGWTANIGISAGDSEGAY